MPSDTAASSYALVADIGGTNTRVALAQGTVLQPETVTKFRNADFPDLETVLRTFVKGQGAPECSGACIAIAGPVRDGVGELTNLDWTMDNATLTRATGAKNVSILNDLQAQGHALGQLQPDSLRQIMPVKDHAKDAARLVIGVGTGFNVAPVYADRETRVVAASEAGHVNLPIQDKDDLQLWQYIEKTHGFPSVEDVLSGRGLERIYGFTCQSAGLSGNLTAAEIFAAFEAGSDPQAIEAATLFARMLGTVAGNLALIHLPFGGIYLAGGVARAFAPHLEQLGFKDTFRDKGRFAEFMDGFGVSAIEDDFAALSGCATYLVQRAGSA